MTGKEEGKGRKDEAGGDEEEVKRIRRMKGNWKQEGREIGRRK